ncbi:MAG: hypothetical protein H3C53_01060 [Trueperaceae bacterium]|nr:hypothetical protein [Trueperaceae bacterium]
MPRPREGSVVRAARAFVKALHSLAVLAFAVAAGYLIYCGFTGVRTAWVGWALAAVGVEALLYVGFGRKCPLTMLARWLGDDGGHDYLFEWLLGRRRIWLVSRVLAGLAGVGVLSVALGSLIRWVR